MKIRILNSSLARTTLACLALSVFGGFVSAEEVKLFNGKDFSNWHGRSTTDPKTYASLAEEKKAAKLVKSDTKAAAEEKKDAEEKKAAKL